MVIADEAHRSQYDFIDGFARKTKWAQLEAIVGAEKPVRIVAQDSVQHFEKRLEAMDNERRQTLERGRAHREAVNRQRLKEAA